MKSLDEVVKKLKEVKIQGANNIAIAGINAYLLNHDKTSIKKILEARPTEPLLFNAINILEKSEDKDLTAKKIIFYIKNANKKISEFGSELIKNDSNIFTHCHSSSVIEILKQAKLQKKKFTVYNTETQPLLQGRKTAKELAQLNIDVVHVADNAIEYSLKKCDLFLFGADAFLNKGIVNKIGTKTYCQIAKLYRIPRYSCGISLKVADSIKLESRAGKEIWDERNKKIKVLNPAFDLVDKNLVTGIISEYGILSYSEFLKKSKKILANFKDDSNIH
ncbi:MAG: translation initiation factor eIF-2B [Nanoarchaeota archaeon]